MFGKKKKLAEQQAAEEAKRQQEVATPQDNGGADALFSEDNGIDFLESELVLDDDEEVEAEILTDEEASQLDELQAFLVGAADEEKSEDGAADEVKEERQSPAADDGETAEENASAVEDETAKESEVVSEEPAEEPQEEAAQEPAQAEETAENVAESEEDEPTEEAESLEEDNETSDEDVVEDEEEAEEETEQEEPQEAEEEQEEVVYVVDGPEDDDEVVRPARLVKLPHLIDYMIAQGMSKSMKMKVALMLVQTYNKFKDSPEDKKICMQCIAKIMQELMKK